MRGNSGDFHLLSLGISNLGGAVPPVSARPQMSKCQCADNKRHAEGIDTVVFC